MKYLFLFVHLRHTSSVFGIAISDESLGFLIFMINTDAFVNFQLLGWISIKLSWALSMLRTNYVLLRVMICLQSILSNWGHRLVWTSVKSVFRKDPSTGLNSGLFCRVHSPWRFCAHWPASHPWVCGPKQMFCRGLLSTVE